MLCFLPFPRIRPFTTQLFFFFFFFFFLFSVIDRNKWSFFSLPEFPLRLEAISLLFFQGSGKRWRTTRFSSFFLTFFFHSVMWPFPYSSLPTNGMKMAFFFFPKSLTTEGEAVFPLFFFSCSTMHEEKKPPLFFSLSTNGGR